MPTMASKQRWRQALLWSTVTVTLAGPLTEHARAQAGSLEMEPTDSLPAVAHSTADEPVDSPPRSGAGVASPAEAQRLRIDHPQVIDTARLQSGTTTINLFGIEGLSGEAVEGLRSFLASTDQRLTCEAHDMAGSVCLLSDGTDLAQVALVNGAARTTPDAPDAYKEQETAAQTARRGIWENLPPPPEAISHPTVTNTAVLLAGGKSYPLDGLEGLGQPYASQLQGYIAANGDSLTCSAQGHTGYYICLLGDGTDIAKVALVNGAARVRPDAPDSYRLEQAEALNNHRGLWFNATPEMVTLATTVQPDMYAIMPGDNGEDGISYVGGAPMAVVGGESVMLVYGGGVGWGYYDHYHHWRGAPDRYRAHMEHYHPGAHGLRGYRHEEGFRREAGFHRGEAMGHQGGFAHQAAMNHEMGMRPAGARPGIAPGMAGRRGPAGGGFVRPTAMASAGGFHPGAGAMHAAAPAMHAAAPAMHASAPAMHAAAPAAHVPSSGGKHH